ncbi:MAG: hypothetical protein HZB43_13125 [candidate division Zixibacteria bacterium]|nr:hypothetical protein [candidate division Zixibacteria bacterium]
MKLAVTVLSIALLLVCGRSPATADPIPVIADSQAVLGPKIYVDCGSCDMDYLRTEIGFVNFVRDRRLADVDILVSTQQTGSGGTQYTLDFIGMGRYQGQEDTLTFDVLEAASDDAIRKDMVRTVKLGVLRYAMKSPLAKQITIGYKKPDNPIPPADPWDHWVFQVSGYSSFNGEETYRYAYFSGDVSAKRVTEASRTVLDVYWSYSENVYKYTVDSEKVTTLSLSRSKGGDAEQYLSLGPHWSVGAAISVSASSYSNRDFKISLSPAVEYNLFPYSESTRRQLRFQYYLSPTYLDYTAETIFGKTHEWLLSQDLGVVLEITQPWGSVNAQLSGATYWHDLQKNSLTFSSNLSLKLIKGLSLSIQGNVARVRNLLYLPKGDASAEDILLRQRQLATDYQYWGSIGITYSFGSIYNNVVNPRFGY